jgi:predicted alpha/beta superfamily hydrolase
MKSMVVRLISFTISMVTFSILTNAQSKSIVIGETDTVYSEILGEKRSIWVYTPESDTGKSEHQKRYPVVYLLDGDWHFVSVVGMLQQLSYINGNTICPEMIVIGIPVKDRYRDLTPTYDSAFSKSSGGYSRFISFIKKELMPHVASKYPVAPYNLFIGHSLGGLTVINTLISDPDLFNGYVAIDPSMWWDRQVSMKAAAKALKNKTFNSKRLFLAIANSMDAGMDTASVRLDRTRGTLPIRSLLEFSDTLHACSDNKLKYQIKYYNNETHGSVPLIATYDALHFIFDFYHLPLTKRDYADTTMALADRIEKHYKNISGEMRYVIKPAESTINTLGYNAMYLYNFKLAEYFFELNITNYPGSYNAFDSMGDFYAATGDQQRAISMYRKALSIHENIDTRKKLEGLMKEP